jgi:ATP-dependent DNA helicase DinG
MAHLIEKALRERSSVIVEAGTGTGKTFGYLVPVLLSGKKTVVSTGTKNLQEQIFKKDIPFSKRPRAWHIDAMIMKGERTISACTNFTSTFNNNPFWIRTWSEKSRERLEAWIETTPFGDRGELEWLADDDPLWDAFPLRRINVSVWTACFWRTAS